MAERLDTLVIGGGLAGIAATTELYAAGREVLLLEAGETLGGKAGTCHTAHGDFPTGPVSFNGRARVFWRLLERLGMEQEATRLHPSSAARYIVRDGALRGLRPHPLSLLTTRALSLADKLTVVMELLRTRRDTPERDESLDAFLSRHFGRAMVDRFFAAVMTGVFAGDLTKLSAQACLPSLVASQREHGSALRGALRSMGVVEPGTRPGLHTLRGGLGVIGARATMLPHRVRCPVESLRVMGDEVVVHAGGVEYIASSVVLATEAPEASRLIRRTCTDVSRRLGTLEYAPLALVQWVEQSPGQSKLPAGFGYLAAPIEQRFALGTLFIADLLGESPRRFSTFIGGALHPERALMPDFSLVEGVADDLKALTGGAMGQVANIQRWPRAVFQPTVGHAEAISAITEGLAGVPVVLAGSYIGGGAMKDALASGFAAAEQILETFRADRLVFAPTPTSSTSVTAFTAHP